MIILKTKNGQIQCVKIGTVHCKRYVGQFSTLQGKADTGLWYTVVGGQPFAIEGEGATPYDAIRDAANRTRDRINAMNRALQTLTTATELVLKAEQFLS